MVSHALEHTKLFFQITLSLISRSASYGFGLVKISFPMIASGKSDHVESPIGKRLKLERHFVFRLQS